MGCHVSAPPRAAVEQTDAAEDTDAAAPGKEPSSGSGQGSKGDGLPQMETSVPGPAPAPPEPPKPELRQMLDLLPGRGGNGSLTDVWLQASFALQLRQLIRENPYLEPGYSAQPHPLQSLVDRSRKSCEARSFTQAHKHLQRVFLGLQAERELIAEAFRFFDISKSGDLDEPEFKHMCSYLGWGESELSMVDLDKDGKVTLQDMQGFVGFMGGVQQLFERRSLRISTSRADASNYAGITLGAHVRSHFYVRGQKSGMWKEAVVAAVDVEMKRFGNSGPATVGVLLEFAFGPGERWKTRQVVPLHWVLGKVEDATVLSVMKGIGMVDGQQSLWALLLPDSEMQAMRRLTSSQQDALSQIRKNATQKHNDALPEVRERFKSLNYSELELQAVLGWVQDLAPLVVHVPLDETGRFMETDEYFRNQFEIIILLNRRGKGNDEHARFGWESRLFGKAYDKAEAFERVKYGAVNILNDYKGVHDVRSFGYGDSFVVLKDVRLRTSFTFADSCCCSLKDMGTLDKYAHILSRFNDREIHAIVAVATAQIAPENQGVHADIGAAQLELIRGSTQDPTADWVTVGFRGLAVQSGCHYFEVILYEGCRAPQVGVLAVDFERRPYSKSGEGVGDDEHGWAVDGQNCACWHKGHARAWGTAWPCKPIKDVPKAGAPSGTANERALSEDVVIGVAVDLDQRLLRFSTNGVWDREEAFGGGDIPRGTNLYPAISVRGRAAFVMGPKFRHSPPTSTGNWSMGSKKGFGQWPGTFGGIVRVDCPELGDSKMLSGFKEYQVHGELSLKRNVQRLVAHPKYREKQKTERSYARLVPGNWAFSGSYRRAGAMQARAVYKSEKGGVIHWDPQAELWKISETEDLRTFVAWAPLAAESPLEPPRVGWKVPDEIRGVLGDVDAFKDALSEAGVSAEDVRKIVDTLAKAPESAPNGPKQVYRVNDVWNLTDELKQVNCTATADSIWEAAITKMQKKLLSGQGVPVSAQVVESSHPHMSPEDWQRAVTIPGALELCVQFASRSCTVDSASTLQILAGGLDRDAAGPGSRVELPVPGGSLLGTLMERSDNGSTWRVRLDRRPAEKPSIQEPSDSEWKVGDTVEAEFLSGVWYKATIAEIEDEVDWYNAERVATGYLVDWADGTKEDRNKAPGQLRKPKPGGKPVFVEDMPKYGLLPFPDADRFALCREEPKVIKVEYKGVPVGSEIQQFRLDVGSPLTPFSVSSFSSSGPAQEQGVKDGWFLDVSATFQQMPKHQVFSELLQGLGNMGPAPTGKQTNAQKKQRMERLLDAGFKQPEALLQRLNQGLLALQDVTLHFTNSASLQKPKLLPEATVTYGANQRIGSEVKLFTASPQGQVCIDAFNKKGPAQTAGVRTDWVLDIEKTKANNPDKEEAFKGDVLKENPNVLLSMSGVSLAFKQPNTQKAVRFTGSGPVNSETWCCKELPGNSAVFKFSCHSGNDREEALRWGVWALVLPVGAPKLSVQDLDTLAHNWVGVCGKAKGDMGTVEVERDEWDEARLRALCARHGWEFEWMTEDGERKRRANERQAFLKDAGDMSVACRSAEAAGKLQASISEAEKQAVEAYEQEEAERLKAAKKAMHANTSTF